MSRDHSHKWYNWHMSCRGWHTSRTGWHMSYTEHTQRHKVQVPGMKSPPRSGCVPTTSHKNDLNNNHHP